MSHYHGHYKTYKAYVLIVVLQPRKVSGFLQHVKDGLRLKTLGMYNIAYKCGQICIGCSDQSIEPTTEEHSQHILCLLDKSVVAAQCHNLRHCFLLQNMGMPVSPPPNPDT
jgi:hypothetical protein